jgi:FMN-dependent NADH-azoreductase
MAHLLQIDSSIQGDRSVSRRLTARARDIWRAAPSGQSMTYRDLRSNPRPHFDAAAGAPTLIGA